MIKRIGYAIMTVFWAFQAWLWAGVGYQLGEEHDIGGTLICFLCLFLCCWCTVDAAEKVWERSR